MSGGPVVPDIRAVWQANTVFSPGDVFTYLGGVYEVTTTYTSGASFGATDLANTTLWEAQSGTYVSGHQPASRPLDAGNLSQTVISTLASGHGFIADGTTGTTSNLNDTADFVLGLQSAWMQTDGAGATARLSKTGITAFDATAKSFRVWVKVDNADVVSGFQFYAGSDAGAWTNFYRWDIQSVAATPDTSHYWCPTGVWVAITLSFADAVVTGSPVRTGIQRVRLAVTDKNTGTPVKVHLNGVTLVDEPTTTWPNGVISITMDDIYQSQWDYAKPILDAFNYPVTNYVIATSVGLGGDLSLAELQQAQRVNGWEIACHAYSDASHTQRLTGMTADELTTELRSIKNWLVDNGFNGVDHIAYPGGQYNESVLQAVRRYFASGRGTFRPLTETWPPADPYKLRVHNVSSTDTPASLLTVVDAAKANKAWLIFVFHKFSTGAPGDSITYQQSDFQTLVSGIASRGVPVRTVGTVLSKLV